MKKLIIMLLICVVAITSVFATRITFTYKEVDYFINTTRKISSADVAYSAGIYDAFACVKECCPLNVIHTVIASKTFLQGEGTEIDEKAKADYVEAFYDFMQNYSYGATGNFADVYPIYAKLMQEPVSYAGAKNIVEFGGARFYLKNL